MRKKPITSVALLPEDKVRLDELARRMKADNSVVITRLLREALSQAAPITRESRWREGCGQERCSPTIYDRAVGCDSQCIGVVGHGGHHEDGALSWEDIPEGLVPIELAQLKDTIIVKLVTEKEQLTADNARLRDALAAERTSHTETRSRYREAMDNPIFED